MRDDQEGGRGQAPYAELEGEVDLNASPSLGQSIAADTASGFYAQTLAKAIGGVCAFVVDTKNGRAPVITGEPENTARITARQPGSVRIKIVAGPSTNTCGGSQIWSDSVPAAQFGTTYTLPIPAPATFGKQTFAASFAESGALTSVQYVSNTGAGQVLNVFNSALTAAQGQTTEQKAAEVKAQADLIAQQQRLVQCIADPKSCK